MKQAEFPLNAAIEDLDFSPERSLRRRFVLELAQCHWVEKAINILLGTNGTGKSFFVISLGFASCQLGLHRPLCVYFLLSTSPVPFLTGWNLPQISDLIEQNCSIDFR